MNSCQHREIAGVVVLYHPSADVLDNVHAWAGHVELVLVIDNSDGERTAPVVEALAAQENAILMRSGKNEGVAHALNRAAELAMARGYSFLLTMDQDSRPLPGMLDELMAGHAAPGVGLVAPQLLKGPGEEKQGGERTRAVATAMTSGSLLRLAAYRTAGPFRDDFFVDFVDIEYCLRLRSCGFSVLSAGRAYLEHHVGTRVGPLRWLRVTTHAPIRKYYKTRNRLQVWKEYGRAFPGYVRRDRIRFVLELIRLVLFEPERLAKFGMMWRGWRDYRRGKFGEYAG